MKESADLFGKILADLQPLELGAERRSVDMPGVVLEGAGRRGFKMIDFAVNAGKIFLERGDDAFDEPLFFPSVRILVQRGPIPVVGVRRTHDGVAVRPRARVRVVEGVGAAGHVHGVQRLGDLTLSYCST